MYKLNDEKVFYDYAEDLAVVINYTTGCYYGCNALGSWVLDNLLQGVAPAALVEVLKAQAGCPADVAEAVDAFAAQLVEREILTAGETTTQQPTALEDRFLVDGFTMSVDDFAEVQDIILADPVHEVEPEMGWPALKND